jgi:alpha-L-fucosidase 2
MVFRFESDKKGAHSGVIELTDKHDAKVIGQGPTLTATGDLTGYKYPSTKRHEKPTYKIALDYESQVKVINQGGQIKIHDGKIAFKGCDSLTVIVAAGTDYLNQRGKGWKGEHPHQRISQQIAKASTTAYAALKAQHIADYQSLYNRFEVTLPEGANSKFPTDKRLSAYQTDRSDTTLETLQLHYARYLMISCSRPGSLPANLQGLWNESINPPWRCDYHSDVNLQMNYWFVDQTNISECFQPLADYQFSVRGARIDATKKHFGKCIRGWATRSENGIFGGSSYLWVPGDAAWLAQNMWDHYAYSRDKVYLKDVAYPILKELCEFWEDYAITNKDGKLISPASVSPEHGPKVAGNSYEDQLMYDLFTNFIEASTDLGLDADYRKKVTQMRSRLLGPQIGKWGQLQEWMEDRDDPKNQHRHLSHLIAIYPGRQIAPLITPELAKAAATSLDARGDDGTGWSIGWKINLWARLNDGDRAHRIIENSLRVCKTTRIVMNYAGGTYPNLLMAHPPFQIEANFGYASGFCELLMQSHLGEIHLLPSLPKAWPNGKIKGLKARGNYEIDMEWENGKLKSATVKSLNGTTPKIRIKNAPTHSANDQRVKLIIIK